MRTSTGVPRTTSTRTRNGKRERGGRHRSGPRPNDHAERDPRRSPTAETATVIKSPSRSAPEDVPRASVRKLCIASASEFRKPALRAAAAPGRSARRSRHRCKLATSHTSITRKLSLLILRAWKVSSGTAMTAAIEVSLNSEMKLLPSARQRIAQRDRQDDPAAPCRAGQADRRAGIDDAARACTMMPARNDFGRGRRRHRSRATPRSVSMLAEPDADIAAARNRRTARAPGSACCG